MHRLLRIAALAALLVAVALPAAASASPRTRAGHRAPRNHRRHSVRARSTATRAIPAAHTTSLPAATPTPLHCSLYASPSGSDTTGSGALSAPLATLQTLDQRLAPGQTGCLEAGTYGSTSTLHRIYASGTATAQITIRAVPGASVTVVGYVDIEGSYTTLSHLNIDGSNTFYTAHPAGVNCPAPVSQPLNIEGVGDILEYDNYYQSVASLRSTGIGIGFWANADNTIIRYSRIHDVGQCQAYDHLIYLSHGNNVQIYDNWIYNDARGRGVQLYPAPTNARVFDNVIDNVGEGFVIGDEVGATPTGNQIFNNIVANATGLPTQGIAGEAIHDLYGGSAGTANSFYDNLMYDLPGGLGRLSAVSAYGNVTGNPLFTNAAAGVFTVASTSPAAGWHLWNGLS